MKNITVLLLVLLNVLRYVLYIMMLWLRVPLKLLLNGLSAICFMCFLLAWMVLPGAQQSVVWGLGIISLGAFAIGVAYDFIMMTIAPADTAVIF